MDEGQSRTGPQPTGSFDHPGAGPLSEQSADDKSGYQDDDKYPATASAKDAGARGEALPPRAATDVPREPIASRSRGK
jgi:hypothetical protein